MKYDFDKVVDRHGTNCLKYDFAIERGKPADILPLWVADMDFQTAPAILERLEETVKHGIFGYSDGKEGYFAAVQNWYRERFGWETKPEWLVKTPGVVFALAAAVRAYTKEGDGVLLQQPVYYPFSEVITDNGRKIVNSPLKITDGYYTMDLDALETKIVENKVKLFLLCSPHNPVGRVWSEEELRRVGEICLRHGVLVVSDEIHCDLTDPGFDYVPFASVGEHCAMNSVTCMAPTKTFNIAGLNSAAVMIPNPVLRHKVWRALNTDEVAEPNAFAMDATLAAFNEGEPWLNELRAYLAGNKATARAMFDKYNASVPADRRIIMVEGHATYLLWVDCSAITHDTDALCDYLKREHKVMFSAGSEYGGNGHDFVRINVACPRARMIEGLARFIDGLLAYRAQSFPKMD